MTYSFISQEMHDLMDPQHGTVALSNPISADMSIMRTSLWPGLLQTAIYNQARQQGRIRIFESGLRFIRQHNEIQQDLMLGGLLAAMAEQWGARSRTVDFFDAKADLEAVLALTGNAKDFIFAADQHPSLHPGQSARITRGTETLGWLGMLHPEIERQLDLPDKVFLFEIRLGQLLEGRLPAFKALSRYPSIRRDIAVVVDEGVEFGTLRDCVRAAAPETLQDVVLFDVYTGEKVDSGRKSIALGLILQETSHTLTDDEVDGVVASVLRELQIQLNAQLRD